MGPTVCKPYRRATLAAWTGEPIVIRITAGVAASRRTVTWPCTTSILVPAGSRSGRSSSRTTTAANDGAVSDAGKTRRPSRAMRRQHDNSVSCTPYPRATSRTVAPSSSVSATIRAFKSAGQTRRPPRNGSTSMLLRVLAEVSIQTLTSCSSWSGTA